MWKVKVERKKGREKSSLRNYKTSRSGTELEATISIKKPRPGSVKNRAGEGTAAPFLTTTGSGDYNQRKSTTPPPSNSLH